jgi:hypothetical protein
MRSAPRRADGSRDLSVPVRGVSIHAWGLRPRRVLRCLASNGTGGVAFHSLGRCRHPGVPQAVLRGGISRLDIQPACSPVNAWSVPLPDPTHDSGPTWIATPSLFDSFIRNTAPVSPTHPRRPRRQGRKGYGRSAPERGGLRRSRHHLALIQDQFNACCFAENGRSHRAHAMGCAAPKPSSSYLGVPWRLGVQTSGARTLCTQRGTSRTRAAGARRGARSA